MFFMGLLIVYSILNLIDAFSGKAKTSNMTKLILSIIGGLLGLAGQYAMTM